MTLFKNSYRIESTRLKEYDYSQPGEYFVTICTHTHKCLFGEVINEKMILSNIGSIVKQYWEDIPNHFPNIELDAFVIMPNHIHGIIVIKDENNFGRDVQLNVSARISPKKGSLSVIIRTYKAAVTRECRNKGLNGFHWQPRFYEHIISEEKELHNIRDYIIDNPLKWYCDMENLDRRG